MGKGNTARMDAREDMKRRLDPLLHEQAPWLFSGRWHHDLACRALIVANHPTGIADGIVLTAVISAVRDDLFIYANHDILRILPQFDSLIAPLEWRVEKRSHAKTRATMDYTRKALQRSRIGLLFPSGRLARRRGRTLHERARLASAAMIARRFDVPVISLRIRARNSALFYLLDTIHPTLRDVTLFNEVLNKTRQSYRVSIGAAIPSATLPARTLSNDWRGRFFGNAGFGYLDEEESQRQRLPFLLHSNIHAAVTSASCMPPR